MRILKEDFFDDNIKDIINDDILDDKEFTHELKFYSTWCALEQYTRDHLEYIYKRVNAVLDIAPFISRHKMSIILDNQKDELTAELIDSLEDILLLDDDIIIDIEFNSEQKTTYSNFVKYFSKIYTMLCDACSVDEITEISLDNDSVVSDYDTEEQHKNIYRRIYTALFNSEINYKKPNFYYNGGVKLSSISSKRIDDFAIGDKLYVTKDGQLVGDESTNDIHNELIGICVISTNRSKDGSARFCGYSFPSLKHPDYGTMNPSLMKYGCTKATDKIENAKADIGELFRNGGEETTIALYNYMNTQTYEMDLKHGSISELDIDYFSPVGCAIWRFHTKGTKRGDWYIPSCSELLWFGIHKQAMKDGYNTTYLPFANTVWTSVPVGERQRCVSLAKPIVNPMIYKDSRQMVFAFLKVTD